MDETMLNQIEELSKAGLTSVYLTLQPHHETELLGLGFSIQRTMDIPNHPDQHNCRIDWRYAVKGTLAYKFLENAARLHPELLQPEESFKTPVFPPYIHCGGWEMP